MNDQAILQMNVVDVKEAAGKSNNMETIGFQRGLDALLTSEIILKEVVTDSHLEIAALMSKLYQLCSNFNCQEILVLNEVCYTCSSARVIKNTVLLFNF